jgi:hypothetical protein
MMSANAGQIIYLVSRLLVVAAAAFFAIVLWSRTRDLAWMLIVIGTVASYADILFDLLVRFGLVDEARFSPLGLPLGLMVFSNLPYIFFAASFIVMIRRKRPR